MLLFTLQANNQLVTKGKAEGCQSQEDTGFYATQKYYSLFHRSSDLVIGTTPTSLPKRFNI